MDSRHLFLLGAAEAGLNSLSRSLDQHPDINLSPERETNFFQLDDEYEKGLDYYRDVYFSDHTDETYLTDAAHRHLYLPWIPERIFETCSGAKFVAILRDPVERAYSHYRERCRSSSAETEDLSFEDALHQDLLRIESGRRHRTDDEKQLYQKRLKEKQQGLYRTYLDSGYYAEQLKRYFSQLGENQIKVVFFETFIEEPQSVVNEIVDFLGLSRHELEDRRIPPGSVPGSDGFGSLYSSGYRVLKNLGIADYVPKQFSIPLPKLNAPEKLDQSMAPLTRRWLQEHYHDRNKRLWNLLGRSCEAWDYGFDPSSWSPIHEDIFDTEST